MDYGMQEYFNGESPMDHARQRHRERWEEQMRQQREQARAADSARRADPALWFPADGRELHVVDMETSHLINCCSLISRTMLRRTHGVLTEPGELPYEDTILRAKFRLMMRELGERLRRKKGGAA